MNLSKELLAKIKKIIEKNHTFLTLSVLGKSSFTKEEIEEFKKLTGKEPNNEKSLLEYVYLSNFADNPVKNLSELDSIKTPRKDTILQSDEVIKTLIAKLSQDMSQKILNSLIDVTRTYRNEDFTEALKNKSFSEIKQRFKDISEDGNRDWGRVVATEMSNLIGYGSVDKILKDGGDPEETYVFRKIVGDIKTCRWCRKFYGENTPKVYKLSTLLANGSNYGKLKEDWQAVVGATHPNTRTSQIIEIPVGYIPNSSGTLTFVGKEKFLEFIEENLEA